ncbi:hypothetical protein QK402_30705 [Pseudomonas aeruginosa]|nr:hypothetical protein [Pseudomonas aeruginosa]MDI4136149.1 hypothetical protein [Pseudomonas aeruginosa]MDI4224308.1 hypothetical protein [Pseudomonas aeruginosa]MDI4230724.1 hypothetical protein [Pseudomonas aeruginosa]
MILIVSTEGDLHAKAIAREFQVRKYSNFSYLAVDRISDGQPISIFQSSSSISVRLGVAPSNESIDISAISVIWWRRPHSLQSSQISRSHQEKTYIDAECASLMNGIFETYFSGKWVSTPAATARAENKITQLDAAIKAGFTIPRTIITQSKAEVLDFFECCGGEVIIKSLRGLESPMLFTQKLSSPSDFSNSAFSNSPAIYQELIPGDRHMRLVCFGDYAFSAIIESKELDWRPDLNVPVYESEVPSEIKKSAKLMLELLGLDMGVFDLKETPEGIWILLEVNPQGQFLFLEPLSGIPLSKFFVDYLIECSEIVSARSSS